MNILDEARHFMARLIARGVAVKAPATVIPVTADTVRNKQAREKAKRKAGK